MNNIIHITFNAQPTAKQRSRKGGNHWYNPQAEEMNIIKRSVKDQLPEGFTIIKSNIPVTVNINWFIQPSKSMGTKKFIDLIKNDDIPHTIKPDRDNLDKFALDCMSKIIFNDDCQIYDGRLSKYWSTDPRTEIEIIW